jgi:hypothetical protein
MEIVNEFDVFVLALTGSGMLQRLVDVTSTYVDWTTLFKSIVSFVVFTLFIPFSFDMIDRYSRRAAATRSVKYAPATKKK